MDESNLEKILFAKPERRKHKRSGKGFMKFLLGLVLLLVVLGAIFSIADIGGNVILGYAQQYLADNLGLNLTADSITGNPVKGYSLNNFTLTDQAGHKLLSAGYLSGRVNFSALFRGDIRLAEISLGGMSMDIDELITAIQNLKLPDMTTSQSSSHTFTASPAYADSVNDMPDIPLDRFSLKDSVFSSVYGVITVNEIGADLKAFDIDIDGRINAVPVKGVIDMGESAGLTAINSSSLTLGSGKVLATGGYINNALDLHISLEELDLAEMTGLYPALLRPEDFGGTANLNLDISGEPASPKIAGTLDFRGSKIYGFPVERVSTNLNYSDYRAAFSNIQANVFTVPIQGELAAALRPNEKLSVMVKLDASEANLDGLDSILGIPDLKGLSGRVSAFSANISGHIDELNGLVKLEAPRIAYTGRAMTNIRAQMKLSRSDTANVDGKFQFEGSQGYIQGKVSSFLASPKLDVTAKIVDLDVKRVQNMIPDASDYKLAGKITAALNVKGSVNNPTITGSLDSPEFSGWEQTITKPSINFTYADKTLTLSKTEGTLNGMPININGTIGPLPSDNPSLNLSATISMTPEALKAYVPDIDSYKLKGNVNAGIKITGSVNKPAVNLLASSPSLQAMDMLTVKNIELTTALNGDLAKLDSLSVNVAAKSLTAGGITFSGINANVSKNGDRITLGGLNARSGSGTITGAGTADITGRTPLDFSFRFTELALETLAASSGTGIKGKLSGTLKVSGTNTNSAISLAGKVEGADKISGTADFTFDISGTGTNMAGKGVLTSTGINAYGIRVTNINLPLTYSGNTIASTGGSAKFYGADIKNSLTFNIDSMKYSDNFEASGADIASLVTDISSDMKDKIAGKASLKLNVTGTGANVSAKGTLTAPTFTAYGFNLTNITLPLSYSGNNFASAGGTAKLYGGTLKNTLAFNAAKMTFTDNIDASGIDVNALIQAASGGLEGRITGTGKLTMKVNGSVKDKVSYSGSGSFTMGAGSITGFKWLNVLARIHNTSGINYANVNAPLTLQTGRLILKAGTIADAPKNDPMYRYAKITNNGTIDFSGSEVTLNLMTESSINYQLINAIQGGSIGGLQALFKGGTSNLKEGLQAFLSGGISGAEKAASTGDFRTVNLKISGRAASPEFSGLKIGDSTVKPQTTTQSADNTPNTQSLKDKLIDRAVDAIIPGAKKQTTTPPATTAPAKINTDTNTNTQPNTQPQPQNKTTRQQIEDKVKEEVRKGLQRGLEGLFR